MGKISVSDSDDSTQETVSSSKPKKKLNYRAFFRNKKLLLAVVVVIAILGAGTYAYMEYHELKRENARLSANPEEKNKQENQKIKESLAKLIQIPDEEPTIFNVSDVSKLQNQVFFKSAQNGDKLVVFYKAKKAILYRPSENRVIEVATVNIGESKQPGPAESKPSEQNKTGR